MAGDTSELLPHLGRAAGRGAAIVPRATVRRGTVAEVRVLGKGTPLLDSTTRPAHLARTPWAESPRSNPPSNLEFSSNFPLNFSAFKFE